MAGVVAVAGCALFDTKWVAQWRAARLTSSTWQGVKLRDNTYQPIAALDEALDSHLCRFSVGVHVVCAPAGAGKTTAVAKAIQRARAQAQHGTSGGTKITGQLVIGSSVGEDKGVGSLHAMVKSKVFGHPGAHGSQESVVSRMLHDELATAHKLTEVLPEGTVIVIDNADTLRGSAGFKQSILALAQLGVERQVFTTVVIVSDPALALQIQAWNSGRKIKAVRPACARSFAMPPEQCQQLARAFADRAHLGSDNAARLVADAELARTPGFVVENAEEYAWESELLAGSLHDCALATARQWSAWEAAAAKWRD